MFLTVSREIKIPPRERTSCPPVEEEEDEEEEEEELESRKRPPPFPELDPT